MSMVDRCKDCPHNKHDETIKGLRNQIGFFIDKHTNLNKKFMQEKSEYLALKTQTVALQMENSQLKAEKSTLKFK